ncbi:MAG TPA: bifunctional diguanylate cyclase/phosphodiesterase [Trebonia sp.]|nr:bifunctional diguanylate cyclase/phosphodiesterase [Trebonia sp.]
MAILAGYVGWMVALVVAHYTVPGGRAVTWALIGCSGIAAMLAGLARYRPARKVPWLLLALSNLCALTGQLIAMIVTKAPLEDPTAPEAAVLYLLTYPLSVAGLILIIRAKGLVTDLQGSIDTLIMTIGLGLALAWIFLFHPGHPPAGLPSPGRALAYAYPVGDVIILGVVVRLLAPGIAWGRVMQLLAIGALGALVSDVATGRSWIEGPVSGARAFDLGWAACYTAWGAATLHPDFARLSDPAASHTERKNDPRARWARMTMLLVTALIPPVFLVARTFFGDPNIVERSAAATSATLFILVLWRLWGMSLSQERTLSRERALRMTAGALASATTIDRIGAIVRQATGDLIGQRQDHEALFAVRREDRLTLVTGSSAEAASPSELASLVPGWLPRLRERKSGEPRLVPAAGLQEKERAAAARAGFGSVLYCPLVLTNRPSGDPLIGLIAVFGGHQMLADKSSALRILASQVALALERVMLSGEVVRQQGEALFRTLVQDALDVILVLDDDGIIKYASSSATRLYGDITVKGASGRDLVAASELVRSYEPAAPAAGEDVYNGLYRITRHDGKRLLAEVRLTDLRDDESVQGRVLTVRDVTEQHELEDELQHQAFHDTLTGLPNRALFTDRAERAIAAARRSETVTAVLFVDLDDFKIVNDTMGHAVGDELLTGVAERLSSVTRKSDTAARFGGDEFALLIESLPDAGAAEAFADRVITAFTEPFELSAGSVLAGATVGVSTTADSSDVSELLQHADLSLYSAKSEGKRRWHRYTSVLSAGINKRREMQEALEETVANSDFTLTYQPVVELTAGAIHGFEALVRWPHPVRGAVPPAELIDLAEETGLIVPLGSWILSQAIRDMARWRGTDPDPQQPGIFINVSARQFQDPGFVLGLRRCLDETGLAASAVILEVTESALLQRNDHTRSDLAELKDLGVRLALDDFGTGYSSLSYLRDLPIDVLKIDKAFIDAITGPQGRKFAEVIISFAHALDIEVIAEGIETEEQRAPLIEMGCRLGQGYLLARPMEWRAAEVLLQSGRPLTRQESRHGAPWQQPSPATWPGGRPGPSPATQPGEQDASGRDEGSLAAAQGRRGLAGALAPQHVSFLLVGRASHRGGSRAVRPGARAALTLVRPRPEQESSHAPATARRHVS